MRPIKDPADKRTQTPCVRYTPSEMVQLETNAQAAGMSVSDFTRFRTCDVAPVRAQITPEQRTAIAALGQLGNIRADLNRLVKDRLAHNFVRPEEVSAALHSITQLADELLKLSGNGD